MLNNVDSFTSKVNLLKEARLYLLQLHKMLVDSERQSYEKTNGAVSSGSFLNLLIGDADFAWLRKFSVLIANIDEMFDLDDGYHEGLIDKHLEAMRNLISIETDDREFNSKFTEVLDSAAEISEKKETLEKLLEV